MTVTRGSSRIRLLKAWRDGWGSINGPELEPRFWHSHFLTAHHAKRALSRLRSCLKGKVVDIGASTGQGAHYLNLSTTDYWPTDLPSNRLALEVSISRRSHAPGVHGSSYDLSFAAASSDRALLLNVLERLATPAVSLAVVERLLRPGGCLLFCVPFALPLHGLPDDYRRWTSQGLCHELEAAWFELRSCCGTFASLATSINLSLSYVTPALGMLTPLMTLLQGVLNSPALMAERLFPKASALPLVYAGLAQKRAA